MYRENLYTPETKKLIRKRSDHRLKSWNSTTDVRAWTLDAVERRKYILDLLNGSVSNYFVTQLTSNAII